MQFFAFKYSYLYTNHQNKLVYNKKPLKMKISKTMFKNLTNDQKKQIIDKLRNFPKYPQDKTTSSKSLDQVLYENFPWGCSKLNKRVQFSHEDISFHICLDISNICLGIKYGICPISQEKLLQRLYKQKNRQGNTYLKLIANSGPTHKKLNAIFLIKSVNPSITFRFWHTPRKTNYPIGVVLIQVIAVGQIPYHQNQNIQDLYYKLKDSILEQKYFRAADDLEQNQRRRYIQAIQDNKCQELEEQLEKRNLSILDLFETKDQRCQ